MRPVARTSPPPLLLRVIRVSLKCRAFAGAALSTDFFFLCMIRLQTTRQISHASALAKMREKSNHPQSITTPLFLQLQLFTKGTSYRKTNEQPVYLLLPSVSASLGGKRSFFHLSLASCVLIRASRLKKWRIFSRF